MIAPPNRKEQTMTNQEKIMTGMVRAYGDKYLMKMYDELTAELAQRENYETKFALEIVRKEILKRMKGEEHDKR